MQVCRETTGEKANFIKQLKGYNVDIKHLK